MVVTEVLRDLILPLVEDKEALSVTEVEAENDRDVILLIQANSNDIGRLIGKKGLMATSLRQVMQIPSRILDQHIVIKFESINEN